MKKADHLKLGEMGEQLATDFLLKKGYVIRERNWRNVHEEIDIIASYLNTLVIVEVKTRSTATFGEPEMAVTPAKQKKLASAAGAYLESGTHKGEMRFDVISVIVAETEILITHIEDAFYPFFAG
jgi:putative endonuclease